jgi:hypothetical protein
MDNYRELLNLNIRIIIHKSLIYSNGTKEIDKSTNQLLFDNYIQYISNHTKDYALYDLCLCNLNGFENRSDFVCNDRGIDHAI